MAKNDDNNRNDHEQSTDSVELESTLSRMVVPVIQEHCSAFVLFCMDGNGGMYRITSGMSASQHRALLYSMATYVDFQRRRHIADESDGDEA